MSYTPRIPPADVVNLTMFSERSWPETKDETFPTIETVDEEIVQRNKALVSFQIQQIKTAAAIAKQLGRTLVLPPILCGLDRVWFPHYGRFPGSTFALPFICPVDHVINMDNADARSFASGPSTRTRSCRKKFESPSRLSRWRAPVHLPTATVHLPTSPRRSRTIWTTASPGPVRVKRVRKKVTWRRRAAGGSGWKKTLQSPNEARRFRRVIRNQTTSPTP